MNTSGKSEGEPKVFVLLRVAVDNKPAIFDYPYLGPKLCISGENAEEVKEHLHKVVDQLFEGFKQGKEQVEISK